MRVKILRQKSPNSQPYWQEFSYEYKDNQTVAGMLDELNYKDDLTDIFCKHAPRIQWECSCLQGMCGGCAMVINRRPALACETFLRDIKGDTIILEPLSKFPTICDLVVDRGIIQENLKKANTYIKEYKNSDMTQYDHMYSAGKCLKCGLCLEVCPNYKDGKSFYGAAFANDCYLISSRSDSRKVAIKESYKANFAKSCSKAMSCVDVCPMKIPTLASIAKMNRR
ncbi:MAG: succinate dehydrogenase/fumarate reductase iron-sulfur subunit [Ruminococcus sp.]|nr:succinate dehydrogenase/fumarate reductase iron-sulfur subunit [Ruminococcus sp.]